jgi:hypothetical protein
MEPIRLAELRETAAIAPADDGPIAGVRPGIDRGFMLVDDADDPSAVRRGGGAMPAGS